MEKSLQRLLDEDAIRDVQIRYCRGIDRMDWDLIRSCYHHDATDDHGDYVGGVDGFIEYAKTGLKTFESTSHFICNQFVEVDGDTAWAERYCIAYHRVPAGPDQPATDLVATTRFIDRMERRNGEWRIADRVIVIDSQRSDPVGKQWANPVMMRAKRDRTDLSYRR